MPRSAAMLIYISTIYAKVNLLSVNGIQAEYNCIILPHPVPYLSPWWI